jgi:hypothetical protein
MPYFSAFCICSPLLRLLTHPLTLFTPSQGHALHSTGGRDSNNNTMNSNKNSNNSNNNSRANSPDALLTRNNSNNHNTNNNTTPNNNNKTQFPTIGENSFSGDDNSQGPNSPPADFSHLSAATSKYRLEHSPIMDVYLNLGRDRNMPHVCKTPMKTYLSNKPLKPISTMSRSGSMIMQVFRWCFFARCFLCVF